VRSLRMRRGWIAMSMAGIVGVDDIIRAFQRAASWDALEGELERASGQLGCAFFALTHHVDFEGGTGRGIRLHNYPSSWEAWFDARSLGQNDPVHRASHATAAIFDWRDIERLLALTPLDRRVLAQATAHGIGHGLTIPVHVPGELRGSCSFATRRGQTLAEDVLPLAQIAGTFAFEAARRLVDPAPSAGLAQLTRRQLECIVWVARGKTDWEISRILRVSSATVTEHLRNARDRCDAPTRARLAVRALVDGAISYADVAER